MTIGIKEFPELLYLHLELLASVRVTDTHAVSCHLHNLGTAFDVSSFGYGILCAGKRLVLYKLESSAVVNEGVAGDTRGVVVCFGKATVYDHEHAVCLDGIFTLAGMYGDMPIDDVACFTLYAEAVKDMGADGRVFSQLIVGSFFFMMRDRIGDEVAFKGCHAALVEEGTIRSAPEVPEEIAGTEPLFVWGIVLEGRAHAHINALHQFLAAVWRTVYHHLAQTAVGV